MRVVRCDERDQVDLRLHQHRIDGGVGLDTGEIDRGGLEAAWVDFGLAGLIFGSTPALISSSLV